MHDLETVKRMCGFTETEFNSDTIHLSHNVVFRIIITE